MVIASPQMAAWVLEQRASKAFKIRTGTPFSYNESGTQGYRPPSSSVTHPTAVKVSFTRPCRFLVPLGIIVNKGRPSPYPDTLKFQHAAALL